MGFAINLRGDLAKLSDAELSERLEAAWRAYEEAAANSRIKLWYSRRGPLRHPRAYRFLSVVGLQGPWFTFYLGLGPFLRWDAYGQHLALCEAKDLTDEIERRTSLRQVPAT
jgi:hypothetical protein